MATPINPAPFLLDLLMDVCASDHSIASVGDDTEGWGSAELIKTTSLFIHSGKVSNEELKALLLSFKGSGLLFLIWRRNNLNHKEEVMGYSSLALAEIEIGRLSQNYEAWKKEPR